MRTKNRGFLSIITCEHGMTLIELLAATFIFLVIVIPLSGVYLSGVKTYTKTATLSQLHNEMDFVIADIMKKTQDASYFDLEDEANTDDGDRKIFNSSFSLPDDAALYRNLAIYSIHVGYDPTKTETQTISTVTHDVYQFQNDGSNPPFNYNFDNYLVYGLFQLDPNGSTQDYKKLNLYLLIAPKSDHPLMVDGKPTSFQKPVSFSAQDFTEISNAISQHNPYIRMVKTQITVNNIRQG